MIAITAARLFTPDEVVERPLVLVEDGRILQVASRTSQAVPANAKTLDFADSTLAPGLIDVHLHGGGGYDVMDASERALPAVESLIARHGVTGYLPTTVTAPLEATLAALDRLADAIERPGAKRAAPLGVHLEGPFISHARRGVHPEGEILAPSVAIFKRLWEAARGHVRMITLAPEVEGAAEVIAEARGKGVCVSLGHSDAGQESAQAAIRLGARHATHVFNAMRPLHHRDPGLLGEVLMNPLVTADIIADGIHVDATVVRMFLELKGPERAVLITDAMAATGMPDGRYRLGTFEVEVKDGRCTHEGRLAGSVLTLDQAVRNVMKFAGWELQKSVGLATRNAARVAGLGESHGWLVAGARADMVALNADGAVQATVIGGDAV